MKKLILIFIVIFFAETIFSQVNPNNHYVQGYTRSNGTYVKGHYRTNRNSTNRDNYSTKPNVNPYTGKKGYVKPDNNVLPSTNYNKTYYPTKTYLPKYNFKPSINYNRNNSFSTFEYEKIKKEQEKLLNSFKSNYSTDLNTIYNYSENSTTLAIKYHYKYSLKDRKIIELALKKLGYYVGNIDGNFNSSTISGIKKFQRNANVKQDGKVGPKTLQMLSQQFE